MQVTLKQLEGFIPSLLKASIVPFIKGSPALGKSSLAKSIAEKYNLKYIDVRLAECDPTDISGLPYFNQKTGKATFYPFDTFPTEHDPIPEGYKGFLIMLDEFNSAPLAVQGASYKLVLDRQVGQHKLHPNVVIIAAGNKEDDNAIVNPMSSALVSRFAHFEVVINQPDWNEWAAGNGIDYRITSYMNFKPDHLYTFHPDSSDQPYASPRTWAMLSRVIIGTKADTAMLPVLASLIGEGVAREFMTYLELQDSLPTFESILKNPTGIDIKPDLSIRWALMGMIAHRIEVATVVPCTQFLDRFPDELRVVAIREIRLRHPKLLAESKEFSQWFNKVAMQTFS